MAVFLHVAFIPHKNGIAFGRIPCSRIFMLRLPLYLLPMLLAYVLLIMGNEMERSHVGAPDVGLIHTTKSQTECSWACHNNTTSHCLVYHEGMPNWLREFLHVPYFGFISLLRSSGNYQLANLVFLAALWPLLMSIGIMRCVLLLKRQWKGWRWLSWVSWLFLAITVALSPYIFLHNSPYHYLTDFIIALARWSGLSYYDINALVFVLGWPALTLSVMVMWPILEIRHRKASRRSP